MNLIVFFTDQQRWDTSGLHGNPLDLMPNFDRMAQRGTHLYHSFTCQPVCGPARSCLQTGRYATETGCFRNGIPLPTGAKTLAHHFNAAGKVTKPLTHPNLVKCRHHHRLTGHLCGARRQKGQRQQNL